MSTYWPTRPREGLDRRLHLLRPEGEEVHHGVEARLLGHPAQEGPSSRSPVDHVDAARAGARRCGPGSAR